MYAVSVNGKRHFDARNLSEFLDKGYTFLDDDENPVADEDVEEVAQKEVEEHSGSGISTEQLIEQLKTQGIQINKED